MFRRLFRFSMPLALTSALVWLVVSALASSGGGSVAPTGPDANGQAGNASVSFTITLAPVVTTGLLQPVQVTHAGDGSGRLFVVETSSREAYTPTRRFYEALGYYEAGRIPGFYGPGDDKVIFLKAAPDATRLNK